MLLLSSYGTRYLSKKARNGLTPMEELVKRAKRDDVNSFSFYHLVHNSDGLYPKRLSVLVNANPDSVH
jgi:hypothetical protein